LKRSESIALAKSGAPARPHTRVTIRNQSNAIPAASREPQTGTIA